MATQQISHIQNVDRGEQVGNNALSHNFGCFKVPKIDFLYFNGDNARSWI